MENKKRMRFYFLKIFSVEKTLTLFVRLIKKYDICSHDSDRDHI